MYTPQGFEIHVSSGGPGGLVRGDFQPVVPVAFVAYVRCGVLQARCLSARPLPGIYRKRNDTPAIRRMFSMALWMAVVVVPVQALIGDMHGLNTPEASAGQMSAIEGH